MPKNTDNGSLPNGTGERNSFSPGQRFNPYKRFNGSFIPEGICRYKGLSPGAKIVHGRLMRYAGEDGLAYPAISTLATECGMSDAQARRYLKELKGKGFLDFNENEKHYEADGSGGTYIFSFLWHSAFDGDVGQCRKNFVNRHRGVHKTEPLPLHKSGPLPLYKTEPKESHHQEGYKKRVSSEGTSKQPYKPVQHIGQQQADQKPQSLKAHDDDSLHREAPVQVRSNPVYPEPVTQADAKRNVRTMIERSAEKDPQNVMTILESRVPDDGWIPLWRGIEHTGAPEKARGGYFVKKAKEAAVISGSALKRIDAYAMEPKERPRCGKCNGGGYLGADTFCDCPMGNEVAKVHAARKEKQGKAAASGSSSVVAPQEPAATLSIASTSPVHRPASRVPAQCAFTRIGSLIAGQSPTINRAAAAAG